MTANALRAQFNATFGLSGEWPRAYRVDAETYANCCQAVFDNVNEDFNKTVQLGIEHNGLMFKGVELIYDPAV